MSICYTLVRRAAGKQAAALNKLLDTLDFNIDDLNITHIGFSKSVIDQFDMIVYSDTRGTKILKSVYTKTGVIN